MTRLAVISDIHGNSLALRAVLADLDAQGGDAHLIVLGDLAVYGPDPDGVLALLRKREPAFYVGGNTDRYLVEGRYRDSLSQPGWQAQVLSSFPWTASQLGIAGLRFLAGLPPTQLLHFGRGHVVLAAHGSPRDDEENIGIDTPDADLVTMFGDLPYNLLLCAHTHQPLDRIVAGRRIVNVGSVGLPFDGDTRAGYTLIDLQPGGGYRVSFRRVAYNTEAVVQQLLAVDHPAATVGVYNLRTARPLGRKLIYPESMRTGNPGARRQNRDEAANLETDCPLRPKIPLAVNGRVVVGSVESARLSVEVAL
jgi:predicted phosphodiesterase